ncbi:PREDICTED: putative ammonium transporter 1 [Acropora digitifera]|uniref:putative ammonium transporter 1 n=1 Tax=Acropora digitifera TaxID=70779 RepID=UPI00077A0803|nr:PREDICTED: putative ammonium transporter 1 [Acropora digitifera]
MASNCTLSALQANFDQAFLIFMSCLIFFMQAGFAFLEAGSVRSKNTTNILIKNVLDVFMGAIGYWLFGYAFAFGEAGNAFIGYQYFALADLPVNKYSHWVFHFVFAATAATIVSGAMAERTEFRAYLAYSCFLSGNKDRAARQNLPKMTTHSVPVHLRAAGALTAMMIKRLGYAEKYWSLLFTINGGLTGMVALCAGCNTIHPYAAFIVGIIAGMTYVSWSNVVLFFKIDDPLDAVAGNRFGWNILGVVVIMAWSASLASLLFGFLHLTKQLRVPEEIELKGLDIPKHGEPAYPLDSYGDGWTLAQKRITPKGKVGSNQAIVVEEYADAV